LKLQFDANQQYQLDAIAAVVDLFEGQPQGSPEFSVIKAGEFGALFAGQEQTELGVGNRILLGEEKLRENARAVQLRNDIDVPTPDADLDGWELFDGPSNSRRRCPHFSVEMETGTGKTYVYLRTILELARRYGFQKFAIVVPSVAIREGVLKSLEITAGHFRSLYNNLPMEHFVYDGKRVNRLRQFAVSNTLQICIINIQAFNKKDKAVIYKESDKLSGRQPIEFVQAARPIVIIDEPQSVEGGEEGAGITALQELNPLCTLRYSATHRNPYNLVYRLDPVRAFELKLVKQIFVVGTSAEGGANDPFIRVEKIDYKSGIKAKARIHANASGGPKEKSVTLRGGSDLFVMSNEREAYENGFSVAEISAEPGNEFLRFNNGRILKQGEQLGGLRDSVWRSQIRSTVAKHLEKELQVRGRGIKVLSLVFVDRVANYRDYDAARKPGKGKFAAAFEEALGELAREERFKGLDWLRLPIESLHNGYFAQDRSGALKDTKGDTQADDDVYNLIMKDKERLLSAEEPLRFIFSHSALREGWDSPNVFQICTLNETRSTIKKRQEIGRGLRLPVDQTGQRVFDESINRLHVIANESYEDFAKALQTEYEEDCGVTFGKVPIRALAGMTRVVDGVEKPIGPDTAEAIRTSLVAQKMLDAEGRILPAFDPARPDFRLELPEGSAGLAPQVTDLLSRYRMERLIRRDKSELKNRLNKERVLEPEFQALWDRIKPKTTYRVEFETEQLANLAVAAVTRMQPIEAPKVRVSTGRLEVTHGGVATAAMGISESTASWGTGPLPDILAYLQNETELTRSTLARILKGSGRLGEFFVDPQRFMDAIAGILKFELHRLLVDGIKYERLAGPDADWEMALFENEELVNYLTALKVDHSIYDYVTYDSDVERAFAKKLDKRADIKLFVKLPSWFLIETPVGKYNPDWAVVKHDSETVYLVKETKGTKDFLKLRSSEADKVRCGKKHFETLGVPFAVVVTADEV
jgi:type III restriction enzyme